MANHAYSNPVLDGWASPYVKPTLSNLLMHCLIRPVSAAVASAPPFAAGNDRCYGCGATFARAETAGRSLVRLACGNNHVFCKQCIFEYWRTPARKNIVDGESVPSWASAEDGGTPWACICPLCGGYQGEDDNGDIISEPLSPIWPGEKHWNMRSIELTRKMGEQMQEYFQVPDNYLVLRQQTALQILMREADAGEHGGSFLIVLTVARNTDNEVVRTMTETLNRYEDVGQQGRRGTTEACIELLINTYNETQRPAARRSRRSEEATIKAAAETVVLRCVRQSRWAAVHDPEKWAIELDEALKYAGGMIDDDGGWLSRAAGDTS